MTPAHPGAAPPADPEQALAEAIAAGGPVALLGDRDPVALAGPAAAGRPFEWVDSRGLTTAPFDRLVRGHWSEGRWHPGALARAMESGGVFLICNAQALLDDLRQRTARMLLTGTIAVTGPTPEADRVITARPGTSFVFHVDDHQHLLLQVEALVRRFPARVRADIAGPPPVARR